MSAPVKPPRSPFIAPAWLALASVVGLVSALIGDGLLDLISWLVFTALIALVVRAWVKRTR
ncbi:MULTISPECIES: hypothetical protein [Stenotrophomonas]|jgi:hypothetical protein|uniref:hypothetical protein n=1 Tax=Stenotrophomonas TaxID=40323 RepID=UPI000A697167|nr:MULTISPECIES: hypothetical protein [unclassified Stenotrophomonas]WIA60313.1 hypothetical protein POS15_13125 [Stenotrophomonas sp. BIO128-Bstrain]